MPNLFRVKPVLTGVIVFIVLALFAACDVGLGQMVNTKVPVIKNPEETENKPGDFLRGETNIIELEVIQEFGIASVYMEIEFSDKDTKMKTWETIEASRNSTTGRWFINIDTIALNMADEPIKGWVTAIDVDGKSTRSTEIIYVVKNAPPKVELTVPTRVEWTEFNDIETLNHRLQGHPIIQGDDIIGIAHDLYGVKEGYPKILFWPETVGFNSATGLPDDPKWAEWRTMLDAEWNELDKGGLKAVQFRWPMVEMIKDGDSWRLPHPGSSEIKELPHMNYNVRIKVMDEFGLEEVTYPKGKEEYLTVKLIATTNPVIYLDRLSYYNTKKDFEVDMAVTSANPLKMVRARISNDDTVTFQEGDEDFVKTHSGDFVITIPFAAFPDNPPGSGDRTGEKVLHVEAADIEGKSTRISRPFTVDIAPPSLEFIEPSGFGTEIIPEVTSRVIFKGTSEDDHGVARIYYALGKTESDAADLSDDPNANTGWHDTLLHNAKELKALHQGPTGDIKAEWRGNLSSWNWWFHDINKLCEGAAGTGNYYVEPAFGTNCWALPVKFKVVDIAGNIRFYNELVIIDLDADLPKIDIVSHTNNQYVGGTVRISGTAMDNERIKGVEIRVLYQSDANCDTTNPPALVLLNWTPVTPLIGQEGLNRGWEYTLNGNGFLNPPQGKGIRIVRVELRASDAYLDEGFPYKQNGPVSTLDLRFSNAVPTINNIEIIHGTSSQITTATRVNYAYGAKVREYITMTAVVEAVTPVTSLILRGQEYTADRDLFDGKGNILSGSPNGTNPWVVNNGPPVGGKYRYTLYIPLDTNNSLNNPVYQNKAANYNMDIQVFDSTTPMPIRGNTTLSLQIDNFYPLADYTGNWNAFGDYSISGIAWDRATGITVQDVSMVVVYFSRNNSGISLWENTTYANSRPWQGVHTQEAKTGRIGTTASVGTEGVPGLLQFFPNVRQNDGIFRTTNSGIVINDNGMKDGYSISFTGNPDQDWSAIFDSTRLKNGPVTLHYVVFDAAENATHYSREIYIANNRPVISGIEIGTDLNSSGGVTDNEYTHLTVGNSELRPDFRIRNSRLSFKLNASGGNGQLHYKIYYATRSSVPGNSLTRGQVYTIANPGNTNWVNYGVFAPSAGANVAFTATVDASIIGTGTVYSYTDGAVINVGGDLPSATPILYNEFATPANDSAKNANGTISVRNARYFVVKVYDNTVASTENESLAHAAVIALDIDNQDMRKPEVTITPFKWNSAADNSLYENSKANGHIELEDDLPAAFNTLTGIRDRDPKVSGKVSFRGTAFDNITLEAVYFRIGNHTNTHTTNSITIGGNTYYRAAVFNSGTWTTQDLFEDNGWKFSIEKETFNQLGHTIEWRLDFDSGYIANVASLDNTLSVVATDRTVAARPTATLQSDIASYRFDVVPYISGISTTGRSDTAGWGLKDNNIRSADGKYSVIHGGGGGTSNFITVKGFNLNPIANGVKVLTTANKDTHAGAPDTAYTSIGASRAFTGVTADRTSFTMTNDSNSGYLTVWGGTTGTPIPSLNNINDNDVRLSLAIPGITLSEEDGSRQENMPNREPDRYTTKNIQLTDDRYLEFYTVRKTDIKNGYYPVMVINPDTNNPVFGYLNPAGGGNNTAPADTIGDKGAGAGTASDTPTAKTQRAEFNYLEAHNANGITGVYYEFLVKSGSHPNQMAMAVDEAGRYGHYTVGSFGPNISSPGGSSEYIYDRYAELWTGDDTQGAWGWSRGSAGGDVSTETVRNRTFDSHNTAICFEAPMEPGDLAVSVRSDYRQNIGVTSGYTPNDGQDYSNAHIAENVSPQPYRFWYPKMIITGNSVSSHAVNYIAYYDEGTSDKQIIFRTFQVGTQETAGTSKGRRYRLHHPTLNQQDQKWTRSGNNIVLNTRTTYSQWTNYPVGRLDDSNTTTQVVDTTSTIPATTPQIGASPWFYQRYILGNFGRNIAARNASRYFAMGVQKATNTVVIFYYDENANKLKLSTLSGVDGRTTSRLNFSSNRDIGLPESIGQYVSMFIDDSNQVHMAAYDSVKAELVYILINPALNSYQCVTVDNYGSVGYWTDIKVRNGVPYIAYYNAAEGGGRDSIKIAYAKKSGVLAGVNANGYTTGNWEYRTVPALDPPQGGINEFQKVNLDFLSDGRPILGYLGANIEFSYPVGE